MQSAYNWPAPPRGDTAGLNPEKTARLQEAETILESRGDSGGDVKSNEVVPSDLEFFLAFDHLAREFGYKILKPKDSKPPA
jgi:hypothetical protein